MSKLNYFETLANRSKIYRVDHIWEHFIYEYPQFEVWSGSHNKILHHYGKGGLVRHTCEIVEIGLGIIPQLKLESLIDPVEFYFAALFHDAGKMYDYESLDSGYHDWVPTEHRRLIHHLPRSGIIWHDMISTDHELYVKYHDSVLHAILAHHGRRDAGSPVAPKTRVAWLLHLCDGISARMDDANTLDIVKVSA